jgi:hypothetical protein
VSNTKRVSPPDTDGTTKRVDIEDVSASSSPGGDAWGGSWGTSWGSAWTRAASFIAAVFPQTKRINTGSLNANNTPRVDLPEDTGGVGDTGVDDTGAAAVVYVPRLGAVGEFSIGQGIPVGS